MLAALAPVVKDLVVGMEQILVVAVAVVVLLVVVYLLLPPKQQELVEWAFRLQSLVLL